MATRGGESDGGAAVGSAINESGSATVGDDAESVGAQALPGRLLHGALRGAIAAMAMTGMREFTRRAGILEEPPPEAIVRQGLLPGPFRRADRGRRRAKVELLHWGYGAAGGAGFAALPWPVRRRLAVGPLYGVVVWLSFEVAVAPLLGLDQATKKRPLDRLALMFDHTLYGLVLAETRNRPQD